MNDSFSDPRLVQFDLAAYRDLLRIHLPDYGDDDEDDTGLVLPLPPDIQTAPLYPGLLGEMVAACCDDSETPPMAVAATLLALAGASIGRLRFVEIGATRRWLNPWFLLAGPTGCGKGSSTEAARRLFAHTDNHLFDACERARDAGQFTDNWSPLSIHTGGLSSGEGVVAMLADKDGESEAVTDKRLVIVEDEMVNVLDQCLRAGNTLSPRLRSLHDGTSQKPATRNGKLEATDPHVAMVAHIPPEELVRHESSKSSIHNGLLNRFIPLYVASPRRVMLPVPVDDDRLNRLGEDLAARIIRARGSFETHWRKQAEQARPVTFSDTALDWWSRHFLQYTGDDDCYDLRCLTTRHRSQVLMLSALFALLDARDVVEATDMLTACRWIQHSRSTSVNVFSLEDKQQRSQVLAERARVIMTGIATHGHATRTSMYRWLGSKIKKEDMNDIMYWLARHNPPLVRELTDDEVPAGIRSKPGRHAACYGLTDWAWQRYFGGKHDLARHD